MDLSQHIRSKGDSIRGKLQFVVRAFAKALEIIPRQICDNAGLDSTDVLNRLRSRHHKKNPSDPVSTFGVDVDGADGVRDNMKAFVWEPSLVKLNAISSAAEAACLILSVDETVRNPQSEQASLLYLIFDSVFLQNNRREQDHELLPGLLKEHFDPEEVVDVADQCDDIVEFLKLQFYFQNNS